MSNHTNRAVETTSILEKFEEADIQKLTEILAAGICDYFHAYGKTGAGKAAAKRAAKALKTARELTVKCSEIPSENDLLSGGDESIL